MKSIINIIILIVLLSCKNTVDSNTKYKNIIVATSNGNITVENSVDGFKKFIDKECQTLSKENCESLYYLTWDGVITINIKDDSKRIIFSNLKDRYYYMGDFSKKDKETQDRFLRKYYECTYDIVIYGLKNSTDQSKIILDFYSCLII